MVALSTWCRYIAHKLSYSISLSWKTYKRGQIAEREVGDVVWKNFFQEKLTYLVKERASKIGGQGKVFLVRKLPAVNPTRVFIGDGVLLKDPENQGEYIVGRLAATEGSEMVSTDDKEEPFVLEKDQCWVLSDDKEARDSRMFGPVPMSNIVGRVIYILKTAVHHGPVRNSHVSMKKDSSILEVELDVEEMLKNHEA